MIVGLYYFKILPEAETHSIFSGTCNSEFERKLHLNVKLSSAYVKTKVQFWVSPREK